MMGANAKGLEYYEKEECIEDSRRFAMKPKYSILITNYNNEAIQKRKIYGNRPEIGEGK